MIFRSAKTSVCRSRNSSSSNSTRSKTWVWGRRLGGQSRRRSPALHLHEEAADMLWSDFQKPKKLDYDSETLTPNYGRFIAQPFERGFGTTIGNALRRVLLSSIEGAAISAVRVEGVLHEFSSLTGVVEDMTDVVLNLKQVPFKMHGEGPKTLYLEKKGPGVVTAADFEADSDIEILDPTAHIATLSKEGSLKLEARLKR